MNGDELVDVDFGTLLERHRTTGAAATVTVAQPPSQFGQVDLDDDDVVTGFQEAAHVPYWVNCGIYALSEEALARFPEKGDHETTAFPELAAEGRLRAYRHTGMWLTVNTPKELRRADEYVAEHPEWLASSAVCLHAASRREAVGLGARVGRGGDYVGKLLHVRAGQALSLQYHEVKDEAWLVQEGRASLELGEVGGDLETIEITPGDAFRYRPGDGAPRDGDRGHAVVEVSTPHLDDVVRLEDRYGREGTSTP